MTLTANPTGPRLTFVWTKQKPRVDPVVMMDVIAAVADRVTPVTSSRENTWVDRVEEAGRRADPRFAEAFGHWRHTSDTREVDTAFIDAVVALVSEMPEFKKASPIDGLIPWFAKEMNRLRALQIDPNADEYPAYYAAQYTRLRQALAEDPVVVEWFEKKRPNLSKLGAEELLDAVDAFNQDRKPEVVYEWDDGYKIVKLATRTQLQSEGEALNNCLKKGSSYTENYCKLAETGKSEFFSLRDPSDNSVLSIQWSPGEKTPEQVYGEDNEEPSEKEAERIEEWAKSRGGTYRKKRFGDLSGSALRIAEHIDRTCNEDDESIESYALSWDDKFGETDAVKWIDALGCYSYDEAGVYDGAGLDVDDVKLLPDAVIEYIRNGYTRDAGEIVLAGLLAGMMDKVGREPRPGPRVPEEQRRLPFEEHVFKRKPPPEPPKPAWPKPFKPEGDEARLLATAKQWIDFGWDDKDDFDDVVIWWMNWFSPQEAWIFQHDMAAYDKVANSMRVSYGLPLPVAIELRNRGIDALDVLDATKHTSGKINIRDADDVARAVEKSREWMNANKRRRSSRRQ